MRQAPIPEGEYPMPSQFSAEKPYHHVITPGYKPYKEACERARKAVLGMMNEEKDRRTFDPNTFVMEVWQKSPVYQETERLWGIYKAEAEEKLRQNHIKPTRIVRKSVRDVLKSVA